MAEAKARLGRIACAHCAQPVMVRENAAGTLSLACEECGFSAFAKAGERCNAEIRARLKPGGPAAAPAAPAPAPKPAPGRPPRAVPEPFTLGGLS